MAIDPTISLDVRPPTIPQFQIQTPLEQFSKILSLRNLMTQGESGQLDLQTKQLELERLRREAAQQKAIADYVSGAYKTPETAPAGPSVTVGTPPALVAPTMTPPAPAQPPVSLTSGLNMPQPPVDLTAGLSAPPGASLSSLMTPPAAAPPVAAAPAPVAPVPAVPAAGGSMLGNLDPGEILRRGGIAGLSYLKNAYAVEKDRLDNEIKQHTVNANNADELGRIARSIRDAENPEAAFVPGVMEAAQKHLITYDMARQMTADGYGKHKADIDSFIVKADDGKNYSEIRKNDLLRQKEQMEIAQNKLLYPSQVIEAKGKADKAATDAAVAKRQNNANILAAAAAKGPEALSAAIANLPPEEQAPFVGAKTGIEVMQRALNPEQYVTAEHANRQQLLDAARYRIEKQKADAEFGPGTAESLAAQVYANPDSAGDVPANIRARVIDVFRNKYNLPFPTPLDSSSKQQETASKNTIADIQWIRNALKNPQIANNIGPILGRIQNVEQATGEATGLTGADAQMAQEFRTRMRMLLANEAGAMHARMNPKVLDSLASSSGNIKMNPQMLSGALDGVEGYANGRLAGFERQRFGGKVRQMPGTVRMKAPNGDIQDVPEAQVEHYQKQGATVVQ